MSRRSMLVKAVRKNATKKTAPFIIITDPHDGGEPIVNWALSHRDPTPAEIEAALAKWKREQATQVEPPILQPGPGAGEEETTEP